MKPNELFNILPKLEIKGQENLHHKFKCCGLELTPELYYTSEEVEAQVKFFEPTQGWLCFQSEVKYFCKENFCKEKTMPYSGILLYGEVVNAAGKSLHIREDGQGAWILTTFTETEGDKYLVETKQFLGEKNLAPDRLYYHVYWQHDKKHGYHQFAARFTGFKINKEK